MLSISSLTVYDNLAFGYAAQRKEKEREEGRWKEEGRGKKEEK